MLLASCRRSIIWFTCVSVFDINNCSNQTRGGEEGSDGDVGGGDR